jgi:acyl carrier protein
MTLEDIKNRLIVIIQKKYGRVEENLMSTGLVDSLGAVELTIILEKEFSLPVNSFSLLHMRTISLLSERILEVKNR